MRTDIAIDKLCDITPFVADICEGMKEDEEFKNFILKYKNDKKDNLTLILRILPLLLKKFKNEIFSILAIINEKTIEEIKSQSLGTTISQIKTNVKDEDFRGFFSLSTEKADTQEK